MRASLRSFVPSPTLGVHIITTLLCIAALPLAAAGGPEVIAGVEARSTLLTFQPLIPHSQVRVTVTGPGGFQVIRSFLADEQPLIELPGADGFYKYELRFTPVLDEKMRAALTAAREAGTEFELGSGSAETMVQSGSFTIAKGMVLEDRVEATPKSVLTNADGVIRNSLCVGFDCPDAPTFSDSTILMMENNTRIKFSDTSASSFPNNDWEIEANSSLSGGANYLGFNDCGSADDDGGCANDLVFAVESGARTNALYVESDGDIGLGTANPVVDIHLVTGNTPTLRLDQDGSSGFAPQVWDVAGNETNFFIRDVTSGSLLPFRIRPDAPTNSLYIDTDGDIGMGTSSPDGALHIERSGAVKLTLNNTAEEEWSFNSSADGTFRVSDTDAVANVEMELDGAGNLEISGALTTAGGSYPDYVFEPGYQLMSLPELASFIADNGHLPNIATAEQTDGGRKINMTELQISMLEKVEELTLYLLDHEKTIATQAATIESQLAVIEAQKQAINEIMDRLAALESAAR